MDQWDATHISTGFLFCILDLAADCLYLTDCHSVEYCQPNESFQQLTRFNVDIKYKQFIDVRSGSSCCTPSGVKSSAGVNRLVDANLSTSFLDPGLI